MNMIRKFLQKLLSGYVIRMAGKYSSNPYRKDVFSALDALYARVSAGDEKKGLLLSHDIHEGRFVIFSDQHKGNRDGADDFAGCEQTYINALNYYDSNAYHFISLGDCEELWENNLFAVRNANKASIEKENAFVQRGAFTKVFGNHDLFWDQDPLAFLQLQAMYDATVKVYEAVIIKTETAGKQLDIFLTHGHQGDRQSDGNRFSKFFVSRIWGPLQAFLRINPNTPAYNSQLKTLHNSLMYEWSSEKTGLLLITGHTHQPVFQSLTLLESLVMRLDTAKIEGNTAAAQSLEEEIRQRRVELPVDMHMYEKIKPVYFNTGCCCYSDGDITGIELEGEHIRLVKWKTVDQESSRVVLEEQELALLVG